MSKDASQEEINQAGMPDARRLQAEGEEDDGQYLTPAYISTRADTLAMLTLHLESHRICDAPEDRPQATNAQKAKVPKLNMNLMDQEL